MTANSPIDAPLLSIAAQRVDGLDLSIGYGKSAVTVYRSGIRAQEGVQTIPESSFAGRVDQLLAAEVLVETTGPVFLPSWTEGDNSTLIATDTMKNVVHYQASLYPGTTVEGLSAWVGRAMLDQYPTMERLRVTSRHLPFRGRGSSGNTFQRSASPGVVTTVSLERDGPAVVVRDVVAGLDGLRFARLQGSAFAGFLRDEYTTLPETGNRPLEIGLAVRWWYLDPDAGVADDLSSWVPAEQVEDLLGAAVDETPSGSIQQMLWVFGRRMLDRYPSLARVWFEGENRVWSPPALPTPAGGAVVHAAALPAHGVLRLGVSRPA